MGSGGASADHPTGKIEIWSDTIAGFGIADCPAHPVWLEPPEWLGAKLAVLYPLHLISDQPAWRLHSQLDHSAYSMAGKIDGREQVYLNDVNAAERGIVYGKVVEVFNDRSRCLAAAVPSPDMTLGGRGFQLAPGSIWGIMLLTETPPNGMVTPMC